MFPQTRAQRCWFHEMRNVLNRLPRSVQHKARRDLHESVAVLYDSPAGAGPYNPGIDPILAGE